MPPSAPELISVVIPCFNHGAYLREAVDSVLGQSYAKVEIVIVDDGSTDGTTRESVEREGAREKVTALRTENRGLAAARNHGIEASRGTFILPLDADDALDREFLTKTALLLANDPKLGIVYTDVQHFGANDGHWITPEFDFIELLCQNLMTATSLFRRECFDAVGGYDVTMRDGFEDWDFWISIIEAGYSARRVPERLFRYRKHASGSMLQETQRKRSEIYRYIVKKHRDSYAEHVVDVMTCKDKMFFHELTAHWECEERFSWSHRWVSRVHRILRKLRLH